MVDVSKKLVNAETRHSHSATGLKGLYQLRDCWI